MLVMKDESNFNRNLHNQYYIIEHKLQVEFKLPNFINCAKNVWQQFKRKRYS